MNSVIFSFFTANILLNISEFKESRHASELWVFGGNSVARLPVSGWESRLHGKGYGKVGPQLSGFLPAHALVGSGLVPSVSGKQRQRGGRQLSRETDLQSLRTGLGHMHLTVAVLKGMHGLMKEGCEGQSPVMQCGKESEGGQRALGGVRKGQGLRLG